MKTLLFVYYPPGVTMDPATGQPIAGCDDYGNPKPGNPNGVFWTGIYNDATGCGTSPKCFSTSVGMENYANANGLGLMPFSNAAEVLAFCKKWVGGPVGGPLVSGGVTGATILTVGPGTPSGFIPSPGAPIEAGGLPGGAGTAGAAVNPSLTQIYRFILYTGGDPSFDPHNPYGTGANYPGCSQVNITNCLAKAFPTLNAAIEYALAHGEIPYKVLSKDEPWGIINGTIPIDPSRILSHGAGISLGTLALIAGALWFLSGR